MRLVVNYLDDPRVLEVQDVSGDATLRDLVVRSHGVAPQEDETLWVDEVPQRGDHLLSELVLLDGTTIGTAPPVAVSASWPPLTDPFDAFVVTTDQSDVLAIP